MEAASAYAFIERLGVRGLPSVSRLHVVAPAIPGLPQQCCCTCRSSDEGESPSGSPYSNGQPASKPSFASSRHATVSALQSMCSPWRHQHGCNDGRCLYSASCKSTDPRHKPLLSAWAASQCQPPGISKGDVWEAAVPEGHATACLEPGYSNPALADALCITSEAIRQGRLYGQHICSA